MIRFTCILLLFFCHETVYALCNGRIIPSTPTSRFINNGNGTVTDSRTGLMWKRCAEGYDLNDAGTPLDMTDDVCDRIVTPFTLGVFRWQIALQHVIDVNNNGGYAGLTDWRLPNVKEYSTIVERACYQVNINDPDRAVNQTVFPPPSWRVYWSSSPFTGLSVPTSAVGVDFDGGNENGDLKTTQRYIRLVRGGQ